MNKINLKIVGLALPRTPWNNYHMSERPLFLDILVLSTIYGKECWDNCYIISTCVSAFVEILQSLQCKILQYTFLRQYPMQFQDFFSLCQIRQPAWLQLDHRKLGPSEMRLLPDPCIIKLKKKKKTLSCVISCFEKNVFRASIVSYSYQDCL